MSGCVTSYSSMTMINTVRQRHKITVNRSHLFCILSICEYLASMRRTLASNTSSIFCRSDTGASSSSVPTSQPTTSAIARMVCSVGLLSASLRSVLSTVVLDSCAASAICWFVSPRSSFCAVFFMDIKPPFLATGNRKNEHCSSRIRVIGWSWPKHPQRGKEVL